MCLYDPLNRNTILIDCLLLIKKIKYSFVELMKTRTAHKKNIIIFGAKFLLPAF